MMLIWKADQLHEALLDRQAGTCKPAMSGMPDLRYLIEHQHSV